MQHIDFIPLTVLRVTILLLLLTIGFTCLYPTVFIDGPQSEPTAGDIVGLWVRTPCPIPGTDEISNNNSSTCSWEFKEDGSFVMTNVPEWFSLDDWNKDANSGFGTWNIEKNFQGYWVISLRFTSINEHEIDGRRELFIAGKQSPHVLFVFVGDADAGRTMVFEKVK